MAVVSQISIGAELGVSVGPIGRSLASDVSAGNKGAAHAFRYLIVELKEEKRRERKRG